MASSWRARAESTRLSSLTIVFDFSDAPGPVRQDIVDQFEMTWEHLGDPGTWFDGSQRVDSANVARAARAGDPRPKTQLTDAAIEVVEKIAADQATTSRSWVESMVAELGSEEEYVELMGIATRVVQIDTFSRLMGTDPPVLPEPRPGEPARKKVDPRPKKVRSWIPVGPMLVPPFTQALVPDENDRTYPQIETLYMSGEDMEDPDYRRGDLHRTQIELVASSLSFQNECFY